MNEFRKKIATQLGISLGLVIFFGGLLIYVFNDLKSIGESIEQKAAVMAKRTQETESLSALRQDAAKAEAMMSQLRNALPDRASLFVFSEEVKRLAREKNLTSSFSFGNELLSESPTMPHKVDFTVSVEGERDQIVSFLNAFELSPHFTHTKRFELLSQGVSMTAYRAVLSGEVFFSE